ncbi:hypothetical protein ACGFJT_33495 [Actinomadura geliboluensis]|uniref:hypothetical protein n=1 Tax=Actinomadura geliboluensis TaxID=882440 RepID=UPI00371B2FC7
MGWFDRDREAMRTTMKRFENEAAACERYAKDAEREGRKDAARKLREDAKNERRNAENVRRKWGL